MSAWITEKAHAAESSTRLPLGTGGHRFPSNLRARTGDGRGWARGMLPVLLIFLGVWGSPAWGAAGASGELTQAAAVHDLPAERASKGLPVHLIATVTYYEPNVAGLFVADASGGVYIKTSKLYPVRRGDLVDVKGVTASSYRTMVAQDPEIQVLGRGRLPGSQSTDYRQLMRGDRDCQYASIRGVVRSANMELQGGHPIAQLEVLVPGGIVQVLVQDYRRLDLPALIDAEVQVEGVVGGHFNAQWQLMRIALYLANARGLKVLSSPQVKPESLPLSRIDDVIQKKFVLDESERVRVRGAVTFYEPGILLVLEHDGQSLPVVTRQIDPIPLGSVVDATGFPDDHRYGPALEEARIVPTGEQEEVPARRVSYAEAAGGQYNSDLVELRGRVLSEMHDGLSDSMVLMVDRHPVSLLLWTHPGSTALPDLPPGTLVAASGICRITPTGSWGKPVLFRLELRSPEDLKVLAPASWWTVTHLIYVLGGLLAVSVGIIAWAVILRSRVREQAKRIERTMQMERERSRLLEEINSEVPLDRLLADICAAVEALIPRVECSCELLEDGREAGRNVVIEPDTGEPGPLLQLLETTLTDSKARPVGVFRVAHGAVRAFSEVERQTLSMGASLSNLAVNQRRLYERLNYGSMHDQLTGLPNRRRSDAHLEMTILEANQQRRRVAVAYIDIDRFKQVNDRYGHKIGDLYLQQIAARLSAKVRSSDVLARIGGDEFLLTATESDSLEEEHYRVRLESCFDDDFVLDGVRIHGSASIGLAVYPDHGTTPEELKRRADMEMYRAKQRSRADEDVALASAFPGVNAVA
ncbi:MAG TPA: GGDEF domain-containing protein [Granulicella sp.]|jgi:diguanylate cyclase (GGDEF)-like protein|nr:GGDEF domain-containing protein [Granulicella sp.]